MATPRKHKNKINWLLIILSAFLIVVLISVAGLIIYYKTSFSLYQNKKEGLVIPYPKGWKVVENPMQVKGAIVVFVSPKDNALDTLQENITVTTVDQAQNPLNIDAFAALTIEQTTAVFSDCKVKSQGPMTISGRPAHKTVFYYSGEKPMVMALYQFMFRNVVGYNVMYYGDVETYEKRYKLMFDVVGRMMKILF